jgi:hypothetical protein
MGTGTFSHVGTSGQRISFQYVLVPEKVMTKKVQNAKNSVTAMFPVMFAPPGKKGINPIKLVIKMKKNIVSK